LEHDAAATGACALIVAAVLLLLVMAGIR